jgi:hypothetical protein
MTYFAPSFGPAPFGTVPNCHERSNIHYIGDCSHGTLNRPIALLALHPATFYQQTPCPSRVHGGAFTVCGNCIDGIKYEHWYKLAKARITKSPPGSIFINNRARHDRETNRWLGFRTRLCGLCEKREQYLIIRRQGQISLLTRNPPPAAERARMENYPTNTYACLSDLNASKRCGEHRRSRFFNTLVHLRNVNKEWLRTTTISLDRTATWTANAIRLERRKRMTNGCLLRGREVVDGRPPKVLQCMACEGIIQITLMTQAYHNTHPPLHPRFHVNSSTPGGPLALRRDRFAHMR